MELGSTHELDIFVFFSPKDSFIEERGHFNQVEDNLQDVVCLWLCVFLDNYISDSPFVRM